MLNGIFGYGPGVDAMIFDEWRRDELIDKISTISDDYTADELKTKSLTTLNYIAATNGIDPNSTWIQSPSPTLMGRYFQ